MWALRWFEDVWAVHACLGGVGDFAEFAQTAPSPCLRRRSRASCEPIFKCPILEIVSACHRAHASKGLSLELGRSGLCSWPCILFGCCALGRVCVNEARADKFSKALELTRPAGDSGRRLQGFWKGYGTIWGFLSLLVLSLISQSVSRAKARHIGSGHRFGRRTTQRAQVRSGRMF